MVQGVEIEDGSALVYISQGGKLSQSCKYTCRHCREDRVTVTAFLVNIFYRMVFFTVDREVQGVSYPRHLHIEIGELVILDYCYFLRPISPFIRWNTFQNLYLKTNLIIIVNSYTVLNKNK